MSENKLKYSGLGVSYALISGITWGVDTVLIGIILSRTPFIDSAKALVLSPFVSTFMHDLFSALWVSIFHLLKGEFGKVLKAFKTRSGLFIVLGALLGGPLGMTCYMLSVKYIGAAYAASITSIYPAIGALFAFLFLKEKHEKRVWIGIALSIIGVIILGYQSSEVAVNGKFFLGTIFALGTVMGWGLESVVCAYGMKEDVTAEHALNIRQLTSGIFYGIVILPLIKGHFLTGLVLKTPTTLWIMLTALVGTASYLFYYRAISMIGAARSTGMNITYAIWAIIIQVLFLGTKASYQLIVGCMITFMGTLLVAGNPKDILNIKGRVKEEY